MRSREANAAHAGIPARRGAIRRIFICAAKDLSRIYGLAKKLDFRVAEVRELRSSRRDRSGTAALGRACTEVQFLGQTVNSYSDPSPHKLKFSELLRAAAGMPGMRRVRFTLLIRAIFLGHRGGDR